MEVACTKSEAAVRQLDVAIGLLLTDEDPLAVRILSGAAYGIFADLAEKQGLGSSWRTKIIEASGLSKKDALGSGLIKFRVPSANHLCFTQVGGGHE